ncbi:hypothetical protein KAX75_06655, partial [candidate division WOR-3 bacterium]|nr:hypothetical protein [candidate division WOR-3 bacterium]
TSYETLDVHLVDIDPMKINCILQTEPQESTFYEIDIRNIEDVSGNRMNDTTFTFLGIGVQVDSFSPVVSITYPGEGDTLFGFVYVSAGASDNFAVKKVCFFVNDSLISEDEYFPYYCILDVRNLQEGGVYSIYASAEDYSANVGYSESTDVFIGYYPPFPYVIIDTIYTEKTPYRMDITEDASKLFFVQNHKANEPEVDDLIMLDVNTNNFERITHFTTGVSFYLDVYRNDMVYFTTGISFSIYDIFLDEITETVNIGGTASGIVCGGNDKLYIARNPKEDIVVYSLQGNSIIDSIQVPGNPTALAVDTVHNELYACLYAQDIICVIDIEGDTIIANIPISGSPWEIVFSPNYDIAYVSEINTSEIGIIETSSHTLLNEISVYGLSNPKGIALTGDGEYLYITGMSTVVFVINTVDYSLEWSFQLGVIPYSLVFVPFVERVYVSCLDYPNFSRIFCIGN